MISNNKILLFDSKIINNFSELKSILGDNYEIGLITSDNYENIIKKIDNNINFDHLFISCNSIYYYNNKLIYKRNIKNYKNYKELDILIKLFIRYLSYVPYLLSTNFVELRDGIIYLSLIGTNATEEEKNMFIELDKKNNYLVNFLFELKNKAYKLKIINLFEISINDETSLTIIPKEWSMDKILNIIKPSDYNIYYFSNNYNNKSNNYNLFNNDNIINYNVNNIEDIKNIIMNIT